MLRVKVMGVESKLDRETGPFLMSGRRRSVVYGAGDAFGNDKIFENFIV